MAGGRLHSPLEENPGAARSDHEQPAVFVATRVTERHFHQMVVESAYEAVFGAEDEHGGRTLTARRRGTLWRQ